MESCPILQCKLVSELLLHSAAALVAWEEVQEGGPQGGVDRLGVVLLHLGPGWEGLGQD